MCYFYSTFPPNLCSKIIIIFRFLFIFFILFYRYWIIRENCTNKMKECWKLKIWAKWMQTQTKPKQINKKKESKSKSRLTHVTGQRHPSIPHSVSLSSQCPKPPIPFFFLLYHGLFISLPYLKLQRVPAAPPPISFFFLLNSRPSKTSEPQSRATIRLPHSAVTPSLSSSFIPSLLPEKAISSIQGTISLGATNRVW